MELSKTKCALIASLGTAKMRRRHGLFTVEGIKAVGDTLGSFEAEAIVVEKGTSLPYPLDGFPVYEAGAETMKRISRLSTPSPVTGVFRIPVKDGLPDPSGRLCMALDGVQDPGNLGTIIRTCHWFGIDRIYASPDTVDVYNPKCVMGAMGSLGRVEVTYCELPSLFSSHPSMPVYGLDLHGEDIFKAPLGREGFIVMGNEGNGLSEEVSAMLTDRLYIPPGSGEHGESLNVAVAATVALTLFSASRRSHPA